MWRSIVAAKGSVDFRPNMVSVYVSDDGDIICAPALETPKGLFFFSPKLRLDREIADELALALFSALNGDAG